MCATEKLGLVGLKVQAYTRLKFEGSGSSTYKMQGCKIPYRD